MYIVSVHSLSDLQCPHVSSHAAPKHELKGSWLAYWVCFILFYLFLTRLSPALESCFLFLCMFLCGIFVALVAMPSPAEGAPHAMGDEQAADFVYNHARWEDGVDSSWTPVHWQERMGEKLCRSIEIRVEVWERGKEGQGVTWEKWNWKGCIYNVTTMELVKMSTMSFSSKSNAKKSAAVSAVQLSGSQLRKLWKSPSCHLPSG